MAWQRLQFINLVYAIGSKSATPVNLSGVVPYPSGLTVPDNTGQTKEIGGSYASTNGAAVLAARDTMVGCQIHDVLAGMSNGQYMYIYNPVVGTNFCFCIYKQDVSTYKYCVDIYGTKTTAANFGQWSVHQNQYYGTAHWWVGFFYNDTNGRIVPMSALGFGTNGQTQVTHRVITESISADTRVQACLTVIFTGNIYVPPTPSTDPYEPAGTSTTDPTSTGDFDDSSDAITAPAMTSLSPIDADFIKLYKIDKPNLTAFAQYLFSASFTANLEKMWNSVSEAILCLNLLPFTPAGTASTATDIIFDSSDSNADGYLITQQYEELDFGSVAINEFYGSCLDYTPYTQIQLCLPYAQTVNIDPDEFMGRSVGVKCRVDVYTGSALYLIDNGTSVLMQVPATLANPLPWSAKDYSSVISAIANLAITVGGGLAVLATGGASTPAAIAIAGGVAANTASNVMQAKPHYQHGGSAGMGTGMFGIQKPYLIIKRPRQCLPVDNNKYQGYPSMATLLLGHLTGFTKVLQIHLDNLPATDAEKKELETILKGGVWF